MTESNYYHTALEYTLLSAASMKEQIDARIRRLPNRSKRTVRISKKLVIAIAAAAVLLISSVAYAAVLLRNQAFKEQTNEALEGIVETVSQPLNVENREGWQPNTLILFNNIQGIQEDVTCEFSGGTVQLAEISYGGRQGIRAMFWIKTDRERAHDLRNLSVTIDGVPQKRGHCPNAEPFSEYYDGHYQVDAEYPMSSNPLWPGTTLLFSGTVNGEAFTLTYTFTEERYEYMRQTVVDALKEHESLVAQIPDEGTPVGYRIGGLTLSEIAVANNTLYFTVVADKDAEPDTTEIPYHEFDLSMQPVIDGRIGEFYYLGIVDGKNPDGTVYSTYLPYASDRLPEESLISLFGVMFRYEWATGTVMLPKDDAEYTAWRKESYELTKPYCESDWIWTCSKKGDGFTVTDLLYQTESMFGMVGVVLETEQPYENGDLPTIEIDGVPLKYEGEVDPLTSALPYVSEDKHTVGFLLVGSAVADLSDTFTLTVRWNGSVSNVTLHKSDVLRANAESISRYSTLFDY